jgi:hypothetical protein
MATLFYWRMLVPLVALFALGYFPIVLAARRWAGGRPIGIPDVLAPLAGAGGTVMGFLFAGVTAYDRFAFAPSRVRNAWMNSGLSSPYELAQSLFSGLVCAVVVVLIARFWPRLMERLRGAIPLAASLISAVGFSLWPVLFSPFVS